VKTWLNDLHLLYDQSAVVILIANKGDLADRRVVTMTEVEQYAQHNRLTYLETSALNGTNARSLCASRHTNLSEKPQNATSTNCSTACSEKACYSDNYSERPLVS
jgi:GTPase SAR1 family protein